MYPFIVFEGCDGSGKSTQSKLLRNAIQKLGHEVLLTREPGDPTLPVSSKIRNILLSNETEDIDPKTEALLFAADRAEHVAKIIRPSLEEKIVICDRYIDSSGAYQSGGRGLSWSDIKKLNYWASDTLLPNLTFIIDIPVETSVDRLKKRGEKDRMDSFNSERYQKIRDFFLFRAASDPQKYVVIDGRENIETIHKKVVQSFVEKFL